MPKMDENIYILSNLRALATSSAVYQEFSLEKHLLATAEGRSLAVAASPSQ